MDIKNKNGLIKIFAMRRLHHDEPNKVPLRQKILNGNKFRINKTQATRNGSRKPCFRKSYPSSTLQDLDIKATRLKDFKDDCTLTEEVARSPSR